MPPIGVRPTCTFVAGVVSALGGKRDSVQRMGVTRLWSRGLARAWMWRFERRQARRGAPGEYREVAGLAEWPLIVDCRAEAEGRGTNAAFRRMVRRRLPTSRANKQRYEPALDRRNEVGGLAHVSSSSLRADRSNRRRGHPCSSALDDTVNAITIAIQFKHIVMAVTSPSRVRGLLVTIVILLGLVAGILLAEAWEYL